MAALRLHATQVQKHVRHVVIVNGRQRCMWGRNVGWNLQSFLLSFSEANLCLREKRIAFVGDSRIRQLFYSFVKMVNPEVKEVGNKVCCCYSLQYAFFWLTGIMYFKSE